MSGLDPVIEAAARAHARIQYRHASSLEQLTEMDWRAMRAFVTPLVQAAREEIAATLRAEAESAATQSQHADAYGMSTYSHRAAEFREAARIAQGGTP